MTIDIPELELSNVLDDMVGARIGEIGGGVCQVQSFDKDEQTATVVPQVRQDGVAVTAIPNVPVLFPVAYEDVPVGTYGIIICTRDNWRRWWRTGEVSDPEDNARHALSNGMFLPSVVTQGAPRQLDADTAVLLRPAGKGVGEVRLGIYNAAKAVVHEDLLAQLSALVPLFNTWAIAVGTATGVPWAGQPVQTAWNKIGTDITAGNYQSPSVKVED